MGGGDSRWKQPKEEDRTEMRKKGKSVDVHFAQRVSLEYRKEIHEKMQREVRYLFRDRAQIEKGAMEDEQFSREAKEGWRFAADAARITDERASSEDRKHTSGGVFVAVDSNLGTVLGAE